MGVLDPLNLGPVTIVLMTLFELLALGQLYSAKVYRFDGENWVRKQ